MPFTYDYFGKVATFDDQQAIVVRALAGGFREQFREALMTGVALEEAEMKLKEQEAELRELQAVVDASISNLDLGYQK